MVTDPPEFRPARNDDGHTLTAIALRSKAHWGYSATFLAACKDELTVRAGDIQSRRRSYCVAEQGGRIVGFSGIERLSSGEFELDALFVEPDCIGRGVGRRLFENAVETVAALGGDYLVIQSDPNAEPFYLAVGATRIGHRASESIPGRALPLYRFDLS